MDKKTKKNSAWSNKLLFTLLIAATLVIFSGCSTDGSSFSGLNELAQNLFSKPSEQAPVDPVIINPTLQPSAAATTISETASVTTVTPEPTPSVYAIQLWVPPQFDIEQDTRAGKAFADVISAYMEDHPNIKINVRVKAVSGEGSMLNTILSANQIAKNALPSLAVMSRSDLETCVQGNLLQPVETGIFADSGSWFNFAKQSAVIDNNTYAIPLFGDGLVITYRKAKIGAELGDWNDILGRGLPIAFTPSSPNSTFSTFMYLTMDGKLVNDQNQAYLDQQKLVDTLYFFLGGSQNGSFPPAIVQLADQDQAWQKFNDGTYSIIVSRFSGFRHFKTSEMSVIPLPLQNNSIEYPMIETWNLVVLEDNPALQGEAVKFAEYLSDTVINNNLSFSAGYLPVRNSDQENITSDPEYNLVRLLCENGTLIPHNTVYNKTIPVLNNAVTQVIKGQESPENAAKEAVGSSNY